MDAMEIRARLPHRYPFLLVDGIESLVPGSNCVGIKHLTWNEPWYADVPDSETRSDFRYPVHLLIESFAQAGALLCLVDQDDIDVKAEYVMLAGSIRGVRILDDAYPGDTLVHEVVIERRFSDTVVLTGEIRKRGSGGLLSQVAEIMNVIIAVRPKSELLSMEAVRREEGATRHA